MWVCWTSRELERCTIQNSYMDALSLEHKYARKNFRRFLRNLQSLLQLVGYTQQINPVHLNSLLKEEKGQRIPNSTARRHRLFGGLGACFYLSIREEGGKGMRSLRSTKRSCFPMCPGLPSYSSSPFLILGSPVVSALPNLASRWGLHYPNNILAKVESLILCFLLKLLVAAARFSKPHLAEAISSLPRDQERLRF